MGIEFLGVEEMGIEEMERWTKEDVEKRIKELAESYTPEWKFDPSNPDAGTALALIFADLFYGTLKRYQSIPQKLHRGLFVQMEQKLLPKVAAEGHVTFGLSTHEFGGTYIPKGTSVKSVPDAEGEEIVYETTEALYVPPAEISFLIYTDGQEDHIEEKDFGKPFYPFHAEKENLEGHDLYLSQTEVLSAAGMAEIWLKLKQVDFKEPAVWLLNKKEISIAYSGEQDFVEFEERRMEGEYLVLKASQNDIPASETEIFGKIGYWIRIRSRMPWKRKSFLVTGICFAAKRDHILPDLIQNHMGEQENESFLPFGECPALFQECYFASGDALGKTGAEIKMTFRLDFKRVPFDNQVYVEPKRKALMKRADFLPDPMYDITIEQVVWEYYNGMGWSRLPLLEESEVLFNGRNQKAGEQVLIKFHCPKDASLLEWTCAGTRYIRVRVMRMNNLYKLKGAYITPVIHDVRFHYLYEKEQRYPENVIARNQIEKKEFPARELMCGEVNWKVLYGFEQKYRRLYLGFDHPFREGPIKIFFRMREHIEEELPHLTVEYYGKKGYLPLAVFDETKGLQKSGCMTFWGKEDFTQSSVCGRNAYWIRFTDECNLYRTRGKIRKNPKVEGMYLNTVGVRTVESAPDGKLSAKGSGCGMVETLGSALGFVNRVTNYMPICGGHEQENVLQAVHRGEQALRHLHRAVTASDYEALAKEASRSVQKVKCYSGYNHYGEREAGRITLVVILKDYTAGGMYFDKIREIITEYLSCRMEGNVWAGKWLTVIEPHFLYIDCYINVIVTDPDHIFELQERIKERLIDFLDPITGNYDKRGWEIGTIPNETQIANALKEITGIRMIKELRTTISPAAGSFLSSQYRFAVGLCGKHTIVAETERGMLDDTAHFAG